MSHRMTRREAALGLAAAGIATPAAAGPLEDAANAEATLTWYIAQVDSQQAEAMGKAFTAEHPGIKVAVIRTTGQVAFQRLMLDIKNKTPNCDIFSATDISHMPILKEKNELLRYVPENAAGLAPQFKAVSDPGYSYITNASRYFLIYNTDKVKPEDAPKSWRDLLNPRWQGKVATGHPAFSGCTGTWALALKKTYGWEYFEKLAANKPRVGRSAVDPVTLISAGEAWVGLASANLAYLTADRGNPIGINYPTDGLVLCVTPSAIPAQAPHPAAAKLFMEWMMSPAYSRMIAADGSDPVRADVPARPGMPPLAEQKIISLTVDEIRKGVPEVIEQWRDTFGS